MKWFNGNKGFGFIIRDNGEEIFVHFRSIQGGGRRGLRDGQRVSFVVRDSDKGPQAEEVAVES
ncbi:MAG: cold shock domain-containing protein [Halioglobus sp.]|nr:cold shock domain-containing protein [Halioglobus sp.]